MLCTDLTPPPAGIFTTILPSLVLFILLVLAKISRAARSDEDSMEIIRPKTAIPLEQFYVNPLMLRNNYRLLRRLLLSTPGGQ